MARPPKFDYDSDDFYGEILAFAMQGFTDKEIADALSLSPDTFGKMKNGNYRGWTDSENKERSEQLCRVLARGRSKIVAAIRGAYLHAALGGKMLHRKDTVCRSVRFADGTCSPDEVIAVTKSANEQPPNLKALENLLIRYDPEWGKESKDEGQVERFLAQNSEQPPLIGS